MKGHEEVMGTGLELSSDAFWKSKPGRVSKPQFPALQSRDRNNGS